MEGIAEVLKVALSSSYGGTMALAIVVFVVLWLGRQGFLNWSKDKVQVASDGASLAVLESLRNEVARLNTALDLERKNCAEQLGQLRARIEVLEEKLEAA